MNGYFRSGWSASGAQASRVAFSRYPIPIGRHRRRRFGSRKLKILVGLLFLLGLMVGGVLLAFWPKFSGESSRGKPSGKRAPIKRFR